MPLTAADIARRTRVTHPAATKTLRSLTDTGLVRSAPAGRGSIYWLERENVYVESMLDPVFTAEHEMPDWLLDHLRGELGDAESAVLFGSYGRGDQQLSSDVDVAVVTPDEETKAGLEARGPEIAERFYRAFGAPLSVIVYTRNEARELRDRAPKLYDSLRRDGVTFLGPGPEEWRVLGEK